jgi:hypothetical protein
MDDLINLDEKLENADWLKSTWDLPPIGSDEFKEYLKQTNQTMEDMKHLPVYKNLQRKNARDAWMLKVFGKKKKK